MARSLACPLLHARAVLIATAGTMLYLVLFATEYGGVAYGDRYFVGLSGVLALFTPKGCWSGAAPWRRLLLALASLVSVPIAALGVAANPWRAHTVSAATTIVRCAGIRSTLRHTGVLDLYAPYPRVPPAPAPSGQGRAR